MCVDTCLTCVDMFMDMCVDMCVMCVDMFIDMCVDMCVMCVDMFVDMCVDMRRSAGAVLRFSSCRVRGIHTAV